MQRIAIVGGGPGGLFTALMLRQKCAETPDVTIFEASDRLGGKVQTRRFKTAPVPYEAGAAELYQYGRDPLRLLLKDTLGLTCVRMRGGTVVMDGHVLRGLDDVKRVYGKATARALKEFDRRAREGRPFDGFYECSQPEENDHPWMNQTLESLLDEVPDENARRYLEVLIHSDLATEPHLTSALYGVDNYLMNDPDYCKLYSIEGGMDRMVAALRGAIDARVELNARVLRVEAAGDAYRITYARDGRESAADFDAAVVALPVAWLPKIAWGGERLQKAMAAHLDHYNHPAHYLRVSVLFERPFWRDRFDQSFFMLDEFGGCCVYDEGARHDVGRHGVLAWLIAGNAARAMSRLPDDELVRAALKSLPAEVAHGRDLFLEGQVQRWAGSVSARPGGKFIKGTNERHVPEPVEHPELFVVGDYMFDTSINGALDSADYASDLVMDALDLPEKSVGSEYFDHYVGSRRYSQAYEETFDARYVVGLIEAAWGASPPYRLLDAGSASGLTLAAFARLGVDADGVENDPYILAQTPRKWLRKNLPGDVRALPFDDESFDFVYETCLAYVPEADLAKALDELFRVTRRGLVLGSVVSDVRPELVERYDLGYGVWSLHTLEAWAERLKGHGFLAAATHPQASARLRKVRPRCFGGEHPFASADLLGGCLFTKDRSHVQALPFDPPAILPHPRVRQVV